MLKMGRSLFRRGAAASDGERNTSRRFGWPKSLTYRDIILISPFMYSTLDGEQESLLCDSYESQLS